MKLHQRGVDLLVEVMDAADHLDHFNQEEIRSLLRETTYVLGELLKRDVPSERGGNGPDV
jgi:hypothetical protein